MAGDTEADIVGSEHDIGPQIARGQIKDDVIGVEVAVAPGKVPAESLELNSL